MFKLFTPTLDVYTDFDRVFDRLHDQLLSTIGQKSGFIKFVGDSSYPKCNIRVDKKDLVIDVAIPYYTEEDIKISVEDNILTISGSTQPVKEEDTFIIREIPQRTFTRAWKLPVQPPNVLSEEDISAECKNGLLTVRVKGILAIEEQTKKKLEIKLKK